jgi:hypothetical protein
VTAAVDLLWSRFSTPLFPAWLELLVASRTDAELRHRLEDVESRLWSAIERRMQEIFGPEVSGDADFRPAIDLTLSLMYGMALDRAVAKGNGRERRRREAAMLTKWKELLPSALGQTRRRG